MKGYSVQDVAPFLSLFFYLVCSVSNSSAQEEAPQIPHLHLKISAANGTSDECILAFMDEASSNYEWAFDALKMESFNPAAIEMALVATDQTLLSIDARPYADGGFNVPVYMDIPTGGSYTFSVINAVNLPANSCVVIEDLVTGSFIPVQLNASMSVSSASSFAGNRLMIRATGLVQLSTSGVSCGNSSGGSIGVSVPMTGVNYSVFNDNVQMSAPTGVSQSYSGLLPGQYAVVIQYENGFCPSKSIPLEIPEPAGQTSFISWSRPDQCNTASNGAIIIEHQGEGSESYNIADMTGNSLYSGTLIQGPNFFQNIPGGVYVITTNGSCPLNSQLDLRDPHAVPEVEYTVSPPSCGDDFSGSVTINNELSDFHFSFRDPGMNELAAGSGNTTLHGLSSGNYFLVISAPDQSCPAVSIPVEVFPATAPAIASLSAIADECNSSGNGSLIASWTGDAPFEVTVSNSAGDLIFSDDLLNNSLLLENLNGEVYLVTVTNGCGSVGTSADLSDPMAIESSVLGGNLSISLQEGQSENIVVEQNSTPGTSSLWTLNNGYESGGDMFEYTFETPGQYILTLENSNGKCSSSSQITIDVNIITSIEESGNQSPFSLIRSSEDITFSFALIKDGTAELNIFDLAGKKIWSAVVSGTGHKKITTSTSALASGTYIAVLNQLNKPVSTKFTITH